MPDDRELLLKTPIFDVVRRRQRLADGSQRDRAIVEHPGAVAIVPMVDRDTVCLIENFRIAVDKTLIELPAGTMSPGEPPAETARRELIEETGFRAGSLRPLHEFYMSPGILQERMHLFLATDLTPGETALEPGEEIQTLIVSWSEAMEMARDGRIEDAKTLVGLLHYQQLREA